MNNETHLSSTPEDLKTALNDVARAMANRKIATVHLLARQDTFNTDGMLEIEYQSGEKVQRRINLGVEDQELFDQAPRA